MPVDHTDKFRISAPEEDHFATFKQRLCGDLSAPQEEDSVILRYLPGIKRAQQTLDAQTGNQVSQLFDPGPAIPDMSRELRDYFSPARLAITPLQPYRQRNIRLLNLARDQETHTTKTIPSLYMVSRAVRHIHATGENIIIVVTTSGNKGTALRRSVQRAVECGLVTREQLRVLMIVPEDSTHKLRSSPLWEDAEWRRLNPLIVYRGASVAAMKKIGKDFQECYFDEYFRQTNTRIWYSLNINNYQVPDAARAFYEYEWRQRHGDGEGNRVRIAAQPVSSAYGLIGYHLGRTTLVEQGLSSWEANGGYWLVQHLHTSDMVRHIYSGGFSREYMPAYALDAASGLYRQDGDPHFPLKTFDPAENLDATFYTLEPPTSPTASGMVQRFGGGGNVVSLAECIDRYPFIRQQVSAAGFAMPADCRRVREWALPMVMTGVLNAIDRDLLPENADVTGHVTGFATDGDFRALDANALPAIDDDQPLKALRQMI